MARHLRSPVCRRGLGQGGGHLLRQRAGWGHASRRPPPPSIGDQRSRPDRPGGNGTEYTLYTSAGPLAIPRHWGRTRRRPGTDVEQVMQGLVATASARSRERSFPRRYRRRHRDRIPTPTALPTVTPVPTAHRPSPRQRPCRRHLPPLQRNHQQAANSSNSIRAIPAIVASWPGWRDPARSACLEQLQRDFPWFDRDREDQENAAAAVAAALPVDPKTGSGKTGWRSRPSGAFPSPATSVRESSSWRGAVSGRAGRPERHPSPGWLVWLLNELLYRLAGRYGIEIVENVSIRLTTDYQLRAVAWTANAPRHINAVEPPKRCTTPSVKGSRQIKCGVASLHDRLRSGRLCADTPNAAFEDQVCFCLPPRWRPRL